MENEPQVSIIAIITTAGDNVSGGTPIFMASTREELQEKSMVLEKILDAAVHEVDPDTMIIVKH